MAKDKLHAHIVLDRSGSMSGRRASVISAVNEYVSALAADKDIDARISLTLFDTPYNSPAAIDTVVDNVKTKDWQALTNDTYVPRGGTPLNDAIGKVVHDMQKIKLRSGENVAIVILTDGLENESKEYTAEAIKRILDAKQKDGWLVIYLGANQDAFAEGNKRGLGMGTTMNFAEAAYGDTLAVAAASTLRYSKSVGGAAEKLAAAKFTDQERAMAVGRK